ncbi:hypothetical protein [Streptacidiphilus rugosus]|uniref:hypothetical protein n=1 Tax=Streptacidiphilus rugosus TaxID=405783 RepID=UPI0012F767E9|nr:hypothetical protein [Streptacidiphilus rugosus]
MPYKPQIDFSQRGRIARTVTLALSGWLAMSLLLLPDAHPVRVVGSVVFLAFCPGFALLHAIDKTRHGERVAHLSGRSMAAYTAALAAVLSLSLDCLVLVLLSVSHQRLNAALIIGSLAAATTVAVMLGTLTKTPRTVRVQVPVPTQSRALRGPTPTAAQPPHNPISRSSGPTAPPKAAPKAAPRRITTYSPDELAELIRCLLKEQAELDDTQLLRAAMRELGFQRLGSRIREALTAAIAQARR